MPTELQAALLAAWPAIETRRLGRWTLRRGDGGNRTRAATLATPGEPSDREIAEAEAAMRAWNQRPLFQLTPGDAALDAALAARGYLIHDPTLLLAGPTVALAAPGGEVAIPCAAPLAAMLEIWAEGGIGPGRVATMARAPEPRLYLLGRVGDRPAGAAFVAIHRRIAMLSALEVAARARRQGLAGRMVAAAATWATAAGADTMALAVHRTNAPAIALYVRLGMAEAGAYHYRLAAA